MKRFARDLHRARSSISKACLLEPLEHRQFLSTTVPNIMPLGDSITQAFTGHASYRYWLWNSLAEAGHVVDLVGSYTPPGVFDGPPLFPGFDVHHEGHVGFRADEIRDMIQSDIWKDYTILPQNNPDIVLLHIGSNDLEQGQSATSTRNEIGQIIDGLRVLNPNVTVLLAQIIPSNFASVSTLNGLLPALASSKNTAQSPVILVDQATGFDASADTYDGSHPNEAGEKKIAANWYEALTPLLPTPTAPATGTYLDSPAVTLTSATNGVGPAEYEGSNGSVDAADGQLLSLRGQTYMRGFGVHADSELTFDLAGVTYTNFRATIGVDDEVGGSGSIQFQVFVNNEATARYTSPILTGADAAVDIDVNIAGATTLRLVATSGGDDGASDHGDWINARVLAVDAPPPPQEGEGPLAPRRLKAKYHGKKIDLCWKDKSNNETGFIVERMTGNDGVWTQIADLPANTRKYRDTNLVRGTEYSYRVFAYNTDGVSAFSNVEEETVPPRGKKKGPKHDRDDDDKKGPKGLIKVLEKLKDAFKKLLSR